MRLSVKKFLSKHSGLVTIIGGLIVFVTFMVHEGLREHLKAIVESTDSAENNFLLRDEIADFGRRKGASSLFATKDMLQPAQLYFEIANGDISWTSFALSNISRLELAISVNATDQRETAMLQRQLTDIKEKERPEILNFYDGKPLDEGKEFAVMDAAAKLRSSCEELTERRLSSAEKMRTAVAWRYSMATWASYVLYTLGWGLGLVAKLYGVKGISDAG
jgi:hypothetical protein